MFYYRIISRGKNVTEKFIMEAKYENIKTHESG